MATEDQLPKPTAPVQPVTIREVGALIGIVVLADLTIYRGEGFTGLAALFFGLPLLLAIGSLQRRPHRDILILSILLALTVLRLVWCGNVLAILIGIYLVFAIGMTFCGRRPFLLELLGFIGEVVPSAGQGLADYRDAAAGVHSPTGLRALRGAGVILPVAAVLVFGFLFTLANPDLMSWVGEEFQIGLDAIRLWLGDFSFLEPLFWIVAAVVGIGLLRPLAGADAFAPKNIDEERARPAAEISLSDSLFAGFRNLLMAVVVLFAAYLVFEFRTLWMQKPPAGFSYAGYAHQGAFWLTVALALATGILCAIFRGPTLADQRLSTLRKLSSAWIVENLLLATCVYNRLLLYVDYNGLTRLRIVGFLGISAVVGGLLLVVWKIHKDRNSTWLLRRQLWVLAFAAYAYAIAPVDRWVTQYNVQRVLEGKYAPPIYSRREPNSIEGLMMLEPLLQSDQIEYRDGTQARFVQEFARLQEREGATPHWTEFQWSNTLFRRQLQRILSASSSAP